MDIFWSPGENAFEFSLRNFNSARAPARATIVPVRRRRESEGRDRQVVSQFSYNRCEPSHVEWLGLGLGSGLVLLCLYMPALQGSALGSGPTAPTTKLSPAR